MLAHIQGVGSPGRGFRSLEPVTSGHSGNQIPTKAASSFCSDCIRDRVDITQTTLAGTACLSLSWVFFVWGRSRAGTC